MPLINFDRAADFYDESRGFPAGVADPVVAQLADYAGLSKDSRVLEIGVGTGRVALPLAAHVHSVVGVDISQKMMQKLRDKQSTEAVEVVQGTALQLPFATDSFDAIVVVHVFHLIDEMDIALAEAARVLKPDGVLVLGNSASPDRNQLWNVWADIDPTPHRAGPSRMRRHDNLIAMTTAQGWIPFDEPSIHSYSFSMSPRLFYDRIAGRYYSRLWSMSDAELQPLLVAFQQKLQATYDDLDSPIEMPTEFQMRAFRRHV